MDYFLKFLIKEMNSWSFFIARILLVCGVIILGLEYVVGVWTKLPDVTVNIA